MTVRRGRAGARAQQLPFDNRIARHGARGLLKVLDRELTVAVRVDQVVELADRRLRLLF